VSALSLASVGSSLVQELTLLKPAPGQWGPPELKEVARMGFARLRAHRMEEASALFNQGYVAAARRGERVAAVHFLSAYAGCKVAQFQYRTALEAYSKAIHEAVQIGYYAQAATDASNASSIYLQMQNAGAAGQMAEQALDFQRRSGASDHEAALLIQLASIRSLEGRKHEAFDLYLRGIDKASLSGESSAEAFGWQRLGTDLLDDRQFEAAEEALLEAFRIRLLSHDPTLGTTYYKLAELYLDRGDLRLADTLVNRALEAGFAGVRLPPHRVRYLRGRIRFAEGDLKGALEDLRAAVSDVERWRREVLPADSFRVSAETMLAEVYAAEVRAAAELYFRTGEFRYLAESWEASEANRAFSLYARIASRRERLPAEYWETLASLQSVESKLISTPASQAATIAELRSVASKLEFRLTELEMQTGLLPSPVFSTEIFRTQISLSHFRKVIGNSRTLVSFYMGPVVSYRWVVSGSRVTLKRLPGRQVIDDLVDRFRADVRNGAPGSVSAAGRELYSVLFEGAPMSPRRWLLALDGKLFEAPLAALVTAAGEGVPRYLIEDVVLETTPGAWAVGNNPAAASSGRFVAVGDPVYNTADSRLGGQPDAITRSAWIFRGGSTATQLPRLVGSATEVAECARAWGADDSVLLTGVRANSRALRQALENNPAVIHIAAHFLQGDDEERTVIALSLRPGARPPALDVLTPADVATFHVNGSLVVLSGCSSGVGRIQAGAGLLGLARAWLSAGARAVVSSSWPVPDDSGELFQDFYRRLRAAADRGDALAPAEALARAQIDMLRSGTWRASPGYWAAYGLLGRSN
jgi:tetratricopeptide (TPR) repeat protein